MTASDLLADLVPAKQAAADLGVTVQRIHQMIEEGKATPAFKAPGRTGAVFFTPTEVNRLKEERTK